MKTPWRALLMVQKDDVKYMDETIQRLRQLGIPEIHVFAEAKVRISKRFDTSLHQDARWTSPYELWKGATAIAGDIYTSQTDLFLVCRPDVYFWEQLPVYCENTIPRNEIGIWCPLTPNRVFPSENIQRPRCKGDWGWCPTQVTPDVEQHHCFVVTGHMLSLMAFYMPHLEEPAHVGCTLSQALGRRGIPYYFHTPSLATVGTDVNYTANDFVGLTHHMNQKDMKEQDLILKPKRR